MNLIMGLASRCVNAREEEKREEREREEGNTRRRDFYRLGNPSSSPLFAQPRVSYPNVHSALIYAPAASMRSPCARARARE